MKKELISYAWSNLTHRKTRSWLTILSILIGIMSIFTLVSFGLGLKNYIDTVAAEAGADKIFVQTQGGAAPGLDDNYYLSADELGFVQKIKGVEKATGLYMKVAELEFKGEKIYSFIMGSEPRENDFIQESFAIETIEGRALRSGELYKVALGYNYQFADKILDRAVGVNEKVYLNGVAFDVVGFVSEVGNPADDANIYISDVAFEALYPGSKDKYGFIMVQAEKSTDPEELAETIEEKLRKYKGEEEGKESFYAQTFADAIATFTIIIDVINGILVLIALVSLIVASVNILNTMYTSVLERTKEIGIMKAIGARNSDIFTIFVVESGLLGLIGGVIGVVFGYIVASIGGVAAAASGFSLLQPIFPMSLILGCISFAVFIGSISGLLPAKQASKLRPVDALRYE